MKIIVLAGGGGTRLWPLSRENNPKQFAKIFGQKTLFEQTVDRFRADFSLSDIYVVLNNKLLAQAKNLVPDIADSNYIIEPEKRDTAPAMGLAAAYLIEQFRDEPIAFVPSDHYIGEVDKFIKMIKRAGELIVQTGKMLDIAVYPTFPSTALGYTRIGKKFESSNGVEVFEFLGHKEKPDFDTAKQYLQQGSYLWHAGYYMWTPAKILEAFAVNSPAHYAILNNIVEAFQHKDFDRVSREYGLLEKISFDFAITEKINPSQVLIIKDDFGWSDVGTFDVLYDSQKVEGDKNGNVINAENFISSDCSNCLVYGSGKKLIAAVELEDLAIIETEDVLLVCPKGKAQKVKKIVEKLKQQNKNKYI